jgi:hypothetical protein
MALERRTLRVAALCAALAGLAACNGHTTTASPADASTEAVEVVPADTENVVATAKGGGQVDTREGSTCRSADNTVTLVLASRQLTWRSCVPVATDGGDGPRMWHFIDGERALTDVELAPLLAAFRGLKSSSKGTCGADKPTLTVTVTTPRGTATYVDDFYGCYGGPMHVTGMDPVFAELDRLTGTSSQ